MMNKYKRIRIQYELTQSEMADILGLEGKYKSLRVDEFEKEKRKPSEFVEALYDCLDRLLKKFEVE